MTVIHSGGSARGVAPKSYPLQQSGRPTTRTPTPGYLELLTNSQVATYEAMVRTQPWLYAVVSKMAYAIARLPFNGYQMVDEAGARERARGSELDLLLQKPAPRVSPFDLKSRIAWDLLVHGHFLLAKARPRSGQATSELWHVPWRYVGVVEDDSGILGFVVSRGGVTQALTAADVVYGELPGGMSPIEPLRRTLALEDASQTQQEEALRNGVTPRGAFTTDQHLRDNTLTRLRRELEGLYAGPDNAGNFGLFDQGLKWSQMGMTAVDAQLIEQRKLSREEVCGAYDISPPLVGILDHSSFANVSELHKALYQDALGPRLTLVEEAFQTWLVDTEPSWDGLFVEFNTNELLKPDPQARFQTHLVAQQAGVTTINERRAAENLPRIEDPLADAVMVPLNMLPVGKDVDSSAFGGGAAGDQQGVGATDNLTGAARTLRDQLLHEATAAAASHDAGLTLTPEGGDA